MNAHAQVYIAHTQSVGEAEINNNIFVDLDILGLRLISRSMNGIGSRRLIGTMMTLALQLL